jgi:ammonia channel protein AmtB
VVATDRNKTISSVSCYQFVAYEMVGACAIILWGGSASCLLFGSLKLLGKLRVSEEDEQKGKVTASR